MTVLLTNWFKHLLFALFILGLISCEENTVAEVKIEYHPIVPTISSSCISNEDQLVFDRIIIVDSNSLGYARVRKNSNYFHPGHNKNLLGQVNCGAVLNAYLPELYRPIVDGEVESTRNIHYIIQVKDSSGNDCIGYIAGHVISELKGE